MKIYANGAITGFLIAAAVFAAPEAGNFSVSAYNEINTAEYFKTIYDYSGGNYYYKNAESFSGGCGAEDDPYLISSWEEFNLLNDYGCGDKGVGVYFKITQDLSWTAIDIKWSSGNGSTWDVGIYTPAVGSEEEPFEGVLDGGFHTINTYVYNSGLFNVIGGSGEVKNFEKYSDSPKGDTWGAVANVNYGLIENCRMTFPKQTTFTSGSNVGGIAGENTGTITKCKTVTEKGGDFDISSRGTGLGGIAGYNNGGVISECYSGIHIKGSADSRAIGGIAGDNTDGIIINCRSGAVLASAGSESGGICGKLYNGTIENCLAVSRINGALDKAGSLVGAVYGDNSIKNCYSYSGYSDSWWPTVITIGNATAQNAEYGYSLDELKNKALYDGWDFDGKWVIKSGQYPMPKSYYKFSDCITHWAYTAVTHLTDNGKISGYGDGTFRPDNTITKAEFIKMASCSSDDFNYSYTDIPEWAAIYVACAYNNGWLENIEISDTVLGADEPITRSEAAAIIGRQLNTDASELTFADTDEIPEWAREPVAAAVLKGYIQGYEDNTFCPNGTLTRAEAAQIIYNKEK